VAGANLYPLAQLVRMHAGQVVGKPGPKIEAFYAESWAFARFLCDGDGGRNRQALQRMLGDAAHGRLYSDNSQSLTDGPLWDPSTAKPMLEHYMGRSLPEIERAFASYMNHLAEPLSTSSGG
jgi:hypothetical protein